MNEFFNRVMTSARWFIAVVIIIFIVSMFIYRATDPVGYVETVNGFLQDMWEVMKFILTLCFIFLGLRMIMNGMFGGGKKK